MMTPSIYRIHVAIAVKAVMLDSIIDIGGWVDNDEAKNTKRVDQA